MTMPRAPARQRQPMQPALEVCCACSTGNAASSGRRTLTCTVTMCTTMCTTATHLATQVVETPLCELEARHGGRLRVLQAQVQAVDIDNQVWRGCEGGRMGWAVAGRAPTSAGRQAGCSLRGAAPSALPPLLPHTHIVLNFDAQAALALGVLPPELAWWWVPRSQALVLADGARVVYDKLCICAGARPKVGAWLGKGWACRGRRMLPLRLPQP